MKKYLFYTILFFFCGLVAFGCQNKGTGTAPMSESEEEAFTPHAVPPVNLKEDAMVATVNGNVITRSEVDDERDKLLQQFEGRFPPEQMAQIQPKLWQQALDNLINFKLLLEEAGKANIQPDQKAVDDQMTQISARFPSPDKFQEQLAAIGMSEEKLRNEIKQNLTINELLQNQTDDVSDVKEEDVADFYKNNPENFKTAEKVQASHILIKVDQEEGAAAREQKRRKIEELSDKIKNGADFAQLARENSDCPSKERGGDLGMFERGRMVKEFEDTAFKLKVGEVSDVVETQFGYHLIKLTDRQGADVQPLDNVRDKIVAFLNRQKKDEAINNYLTDLRGKAKIDYADGFQP